MRHSGSSLLLPRDTTHVVVDPLVDFTEGSFVDRYGHKDTEPIREVIERLDAMTDVWKEIANLVLCKSSYHHNQFGGDGLENLCTTEKGRKSVIPENRFRRVVCKTDNSLLSANVDIEELMGDSPYFGVEGITLTSCVIQTINDLRERLQSRQMVVPMDVVGFRVDQTNRAKEIEDQLSDASDMQVIVVPSWRDIIHVAS